MSTIQNGECRSRNVEGRATRVESQGNARTGVESRGPKVESQNPQIGLLTKEGLALALKVSLRTVDRMLADGEITPIRLRGTLVRFYLPDVVRELVAAALISKRGCARRFAPELQAGAGVGGRA